MISILLFAALASAESGTLAELRSAAGADELPAVAVVAAKPLPDLKRLASRVPCPSIEAFPEFRDSTRELSKGINVFFDKAVDAGKPDAKLRKEGLALRHSLLRVLKEIEEYGDPALAFDQFEKTCSSRLLLACAFVETDTSYAPHWADLAEFAYEKGRRPGMFLGEILRDEMAAQYAFTKVARLLWDGQDSGQTREILAVLKKEAADAETRELLEVLARLAQAQGGKP